MFFAIFILLLSASLSLQAPNYEISRETRQAGLKHWDFKVNHTCFSIRKGGFDAQQRCLECIQNAMPEEDPGATEIPAAVKECLTNLPQTYKPCLDEDPTTVDCLEIAFKKHMKRTMKIFWSAYLHHFNESQRGVIVQLLSWAKLLFQIYSNSEEDFNTVNGTLSPCREELADKLKQSRKRREEEEPEEETEDNPAIQEEQDQEMAEMVRMRKHIEYVGEYLQCKFTAIKGDEAALAIVKNAIKNSHYTIPAMLVNTLYDC